LPNRASQSGHSSVRHRLLVDFDATDDYARVCGSWRRGFCFMALAARVLILVSMFLAAADSQKVRPP
jgi:hypothetical protein